MEGIMDRNHGQTAIQERALLVLTLIAAGEGNHPTVKKALKSLLVKLENPCDEPGPPGVPVSQHVDIIPFNRYQEKKKPPGLRIFSSDNEDVVKKVKSPRLKVFG